jgi:hypothetical protein
MKEILPTGSDLCFSSYVSFQITQGNEYNQVPANIQHLDTHFQIVYMYICESHFDELDHIKNCT